MAYNLQKRIEVLGIQNVKVVEYKEQHSVLGGIIKWWETVHIDKFNNDLNIEIIDTENQKFDHIYLNGKELVLKS